MISEFIPRDFSWASFNYRVLQEAKDPSVPLLERLKFLGIYSSNMDEFYRVRIASLRNALKANEEEKAQFKVNPKKLIKRINKYVIRQQRELGQIFEDVLKEMEREGIRLDRGELNDEEAIAFAKSYYQEHIADNIKVKPLVKSDVPFMENRRIYFIARTAAPESEYHMIKIPSVEVGRFVEIPSGESNRIAFLDDIIRANLDDLFPGKEIEGCYLVKMSRDAELYLEDEIAGSLVEKIENALGKRNVGLPTRFLYDAAMPKDWVKFVRKMFKLDADNLLEGGRYHNMLDLFSFPKVGKPGHSYPPMPILGHKKAPVGDNLIPIVRNRDLLFHFPYQSYDSVVKFIEEAAEDPATRIMKISLYRVASDSAVSNALIKAAENGVDVTVFMEVKARFDEESNIYWGKRMEEAGVKVLYSFPVIKVHAKLFYFEREQDNQMERFAYFGTGNFNEKTATLYCDHGLMTSHPELCEEASRVFESLENEMTEQQFEHLLVAPFNMRKRFEELIDQEIEAAKQGNKALITLKLNSLEDKGMIRKLYEASQAGVKIRIIVRGICCLKPGVVGMSENIKVISIIDRFLEHARVYNFHRGGENAVYVASADWMKRNLNRRIEVGFPIMDSKLKKELLEILRLQWKDNTKARRINKLQSNPYRKSKAKKRIRAQFDTYKFLQKMHQ
jgi:polyphosphate kinase